MDEPEPGDDAERLYRRMELIVRVASVAFSLCVMWDFLKDRPDVQVAKERVKAWVRTNVGAPIAARSKLKKEQAHVVYEALQIVEEGAGDGN